MESRIVLACAALSLIAAAEPPNPLEIVRRSVARDTMNFRRGREYTFQRQVVLRQLDGKGGVKKTESSTYDVIGISGELYSKLIAKDGKPLPAKEAEEASKKLDEAIRKRQQESPEARQKRLDRQRKDEEEGRRFLEEIPEAFHFELVGEESVEGIPVWVIDASPRPDYRPKAKRADLLKKFKGRMWIDKKELQWVRVEGETIDTVSFGFVLARLGKGAKVVFEQRPVNGEVWMPHRATTRVDARVGLVKSFRVDSEVKWSGYKRFQTDSRVVPAEEAGLEDRK